MSDNRTLEQRYLSFINKTDGCWEWTGGKDQNGYGRMARNYRADLAHRISYELYVGDPSGKVVMHTCDNPGCSNPQHLRLGTQQDNIADRVAKGRNGKPNNKGEVNGKSKLTADNVLEMRRIKATTDKSYRQIGEMFGVKTVTSWNAILGKTWGHVQQSSSYLSGDEHLG